jgi:hypothetical protein
MIYSSENAGRLRVLGFGICKWSFLRTQSQNGESISGKALAEFRGMEIIPN